MYHIGTLQKKFNVEGGGGVNMNEFSGTGTINIEDTQGSRSGSPMVVDSNLIQAPPNLSQGTFSSNLD